MNCIILKYKQYKVYTVIKYCYDTILVLYYYYYNTVVCFCLMLLFVIYDTVYGMV